VGPGRSPRMSWRPTHAQIRAICVAAVLLTVAVLLRRPDAAVSGLPLAFLAAWGRFFRPRERPEVHTELDADVLFEGQGTTYRRRATPPSSRSLTPATPHI